MEVNQKMSMDQNVQC